MFMVVDVAVNCSQAYRSHEKMRTGGRHAQYVFGRLWSWGDGMQKDRCFGVAVVG